MFKTNNYIKDSQIDYCFKGGELVINKNEGNSTKLNGYFNVDESYENDNWIKTSIRTFAFGKNRNQSDISETSMTSEFSKAQKTVGGIPIVAKYNDEKDDLEGHNVTLRKNKDGEYEFYHDTTPLGFTSPTSTFYTEEVNEGTEFAPNYKTYITIKDVYLWKRFDATKKILNWQAEGVPAKVSMEIDQVEGQFDSEGYFAINDFIFTAIAALGSDVEPCFSKAEIKLYSVNDFKADLQQLMYELTAQDTVDEQGGNKELEKEKQEFEETVEATEIQVEDEQVVSTEETEVVDTPETSEEFTEEAQTETTEVDAEEETQEATTDEVKEEFEAEVDTTEQAEDTQVVTTEEVVDETVETEQEVNEFEVKYNELSADFEALKVELEELRTFKRKALETELSNQFEGQLTGDEIAQVFTESKGKSLEEVKKDLFALVGMKSASTFSATTPTTKIAVQVNKDIKNEVNEPYGGLFEKFLNK